MENKESGSEIASNDKEVSIRNTQKHPKKPINGSGIFRFVILIISAILIFAVVAPKLENIETYGGLTRTLDEKRDQVIGLSATLAGLSVVVAAVPGDATTPIAGNIANQSSRLVIVLGAIMLEKFLLPITAFISFRILIPLGVILIGIYQLSRKEVLYDVAIRLVVLGIVVFAIIPSGIEVGKLVDKSFNIEKSLEQIKLEFDAIESENSSDEEEISGNDEEEKGLVEKIADAGSALVDNIAGTGADVLKKAKVIIGEILEIIAAFIVSTCVIPLIIIFVLYSLAKGIMALLVKKMCFDNSVYSEDMQD